MARDTKMQADDTGSHRATSTDYELPTKSVIPGAGLDDRLTDNIQQQVGPARYFLKNDDGEIIEDWGDVFNRVAHNIANAEKEFGNTDDHVDHWREVYEVMMREQRFMPNSPTLMNAGVPEMQQLSACFVNSPDEDDLTDIKETDRQAAEIFKSGGGLGYAFSYLRPKGALVSSTGGVSSGPVSFMQVFDTTCNTIKQGGKRRGAQMAIMHSQHPDVGRFCVAKRVAGELSNFNISVAVTDEFKEAVENDEDYRFLRLWDDDNQDETFDVVRKTKHFYSPEYEDAWNDELDKAGADEEGKVVEENFWRDHADKIEGVDEYKDQINLEIGEPMELPAGFIWQLIIDGAHKNGEPGLFAIDEADREHSFDTDKHPEYYQQATNPCAEQMLCEYEACNLGHVNLSLMADEDRQTLDEYMATHVDFDVEDFLDQALANDQFRETIEHGTRFLDGVVTQSEFPIDEISERVRNMRKIGLGLMGFAQLLIQLGVPYGSEESYEIAEEIMRRIDKTSTRYSHKLAQERGVFNDWDKSKYANPTAYPEWFEQHTGEDPYDWTRGYAIRNHNVTTIAPTGTTSRISNTTGGCEPIYSVCFFKNVGDDIQGEDYLVVFDDYFLEFLEANDVDVEAVKDEAVEKMSTNEFDGVESLDTVPKILGDVFVTTQDLSSEEHARMQGAFQKHCDSGISKTINMPYEATLDDVDEALQLALSLGIKGMTVYRDGSRDKQVNTTRADNRQFTDEEREEVQKDAISLLRNDENFVEIIEDELDRLNGGEN